LGGATVRLYAMEWLSGEKSGLKAYTHRSPVHGTTARVASFREGRIGYREWARRSGRINPSVEDRLDHDVDELMA
jgi:hypothetical protein